MRNAFRAVVWRGNSETPRCTAPLADLVGQGNFHKFKGLQIMKKLIFTLLAAVLASGAFAQSSFPDIPANHWAGDAVDRIADLGIVIGFPDGTYRGNEAFTRYQAALVVSRMLDVFNDNVNSALALTQADVDSLRNAVQELASDVAAQGVRLSAAESAIAGLSDDSAATNARLDDVEAALGNAGVDPAVLRDLQNQIASQRVAIDTAQAQAEAAAARADAAYSLARQADSLGRENAADIANLNRVIGLMQGDINALKSGGGGTIVEGAPTDLSGVNTAIERNRSDIANIREFVILLRRDQVALRDRVSALEASDAAQEAAISDLQGRVTALEENPLGISGTISLRYYVGRTLGYDFDIDRAYGLNNTKKMSASVFSTGADELDGDARGTAGYQTEVGEVAQDRHDITQTPGGVTGTLALSFSAGAGFNGAGSPNALNRFDGVLDVGMNTRNFRQTDPVGSAGIPIGDWFVIKNFMTTFEPIGAAPLTFSFGMRVKTNFTPYVVATNDPGFVATLDSPDFLSFLQPTLTAVYVTPRWLNGPVDGEGNATNQPDDYLRGLRLTLSPLDGLTIGGSFAQYATLAGDKDNVNGDNVQSTVFGVDGSLSLSIFDLNFEWAQGSSTDTTVDSETVLYAELGVDASGLPIIDSLSANYRSVSDVWVARGFNLGADANAFPYSQNQAGFGVNAGFDLFGIVSLDGYFDSFTTVDGADNSSTAFGVDATANLFAGFSVGGWFHQASVNGVTVDSQRFAVDGDENDVIMADMRRNGNNFDTSFGVKLAHDGSAANALISGLDLSASYTQSEADFSRSTIAASASYDLNVSIVKLTPYVSYSTMTDADTTDTRGSGEKGLTVLRAGAGLETTPLDIFLAPSLVGAVNYRTATHTPFGGAAAWTASEMQWSVGLVLNEFIFDNSKLTAKYGSWTGVNINDATNTRGAGDGATDISGGDVNNTGTQTTTGYEVIWNYWDLEFAYGVYTNDDARGPASAQAFSIGYTVSF